MLEFLLLPVDRFCERHTPLVMGEELLNDWTHAAFFAASLWALLHHRHAGTASPRLVVLSLWIGVIGLFSTSLHLYPITLTFLLDGLGVAVFMAVYTYTALKLAQGYSSAQALRFSLGFLIVTALMGLPARLLMPELMTLVFLPSLAFMIWMSRTADPQFANRTRLKLASGAFALSCLAHGLDLPTCDLTQGYGTHFMWHIFNALMLGLLVTALQPKKT